MKRKQAPEGPKSRHIQGARPKGVVVISVGLTPQVVTETLYALACERSEPIDEIHMWTTTQGEREIERVLIDGGRGVLYRFFRDFNLPPAEVYVRIFGRVADAPAGLSLAADRPLDDIRTREDHHLVADTLMHFLHEQTSDPSRRLLCSLAGARKTIGAYLALALQFFGRNGDQLFHVLVPPELEADPKFFYPPPGSPSGLIELVEVPVAYLREYLEVLRTPDGSMSYSELVRRVQDELAQLKDPPTLTVRIPEREVLVGDRRLPLSGLPLILYVAFVARRARCRSDCRGCANCFITLEEVQDAQLHRPLQGIAAIARFKDYRLERLSRWSKESTVGDRLEAFRQTVSRINRAIGDSPSRRVFRVIRQDWGETAGYGIALAPDRIVVPAEVIRIWDAQLRSATLLSM